MNSPATHRIVAFATAGCAVLAAASLATADPGSYRQIPTRPILTLTTAFPVPLLAQRPSVTSERWPRVTVGVPEEFSLLGSTTIDLYGVATAEIHALAEAEGGMVRRLYWVQFEGYHEDSSSTYDYSREPWRVELDGRSFYAGPNAYPKEVSPKPPRARIQARSWSSSGGRGSFSPTKSLVSAWSIWTTLAGTS